VDYTRKLIEKKRDLERAQARAVKIAFHALPPAHAKHCQCDRCKRPLAHAILATGPL